VTSSADVPIFFVGCRGSGKSTVASRLATRLGRSFVDADLELESAAGPSIRALFETEGEQSFRDREEKLLADLCRRAGTVVATGGGCVLREGNRRLLRSTGTVIWLTAEPATLWQRIQLDPGSAERRPPLTDGGPGEVEKTLRERQALYREVAHLVIATEGREIDDIVQEIVTRLALPRETLCKPC
jgi:shikimate kinase